MKHLSSCVCVLILSPCVVCQAQQARSSKGEAGGCELPPPSYMELEFVSFHAGLTQADANGKMLVSGAEVVTRTCPAHAQCCRFKTPNRRFEEKLLKGTRSEYKHFTQKNIQKPVRLRI